MLRENEKRARTEDKQIVEDAGDCRQAVIEDISARPRTEDYIIKPCDIIKVVEYGTVGLYSTYFHKFK